MGVQMTPRERAIKCAANYEERELAINEGPYDALIEDITTEIQAASNAVEMKYRAKYGPPTLRVQKKHPDAKMPTRAYGEAAAFDLYALETVIVGNDEPVKARTGIAVEIPPGYFAKIESRSSVALYGVFATGGVIDADYRGEIHVILNNIMYNDGAPAPAIFNPGDRIAQMLVLPVFQGAIEEVTELTPTERGDKGFGSTGR